MAETKAIEKKKTASERFTDLVMKDFNSLMGDGSLKFSSIQKRLAQHLFIKIDQILKAAETNRIKTGQIKLMPVIWENINMQKLAMDAVHRINLGLDALIPNHISPIPYWNSKEKIYDLDLRIGYIGQDYYRRKMAIEQPLDIIYELVYKTDLFLPIKKGAKNEIESYEFVINEPFSRGEIIGGFGYIIYEDSRKNKLILVSEEDFKKAEQCALSKEFWKKWPINQRYKTLVHRVTGKLSTDPEKVNESFAAVEDDEREILQEIEENANSETIDINQTSIDVLSPAEKPPGNSQKDRFFSRESAAWPSPNPTSENLQEKDDDERQETDRNSSGEGPGF